MAGVENPTYMCFFELLVFMGAPGVGGVALEERGPHMLPRGANGVINSKLLHLQIVFSFWSSVLRVAASAVGFSHVKSLILMTH